MKYVTLFLANSHPSTLSHIVTHPGRPPPKKVRHTSRSPISSSLVQRTRSKAPCTNSLPIVCGGFVRGFCQGVFSLEGFVRGGFCPFPFCQNTSVTTES